MQQLIFNPFSRLTLAMLLPIALLAFVFPVHGQQTNQPCSASMLSSFTPCLNFVTNSSSNGTAPTADCCNAISSLTSGSRDCLCLIITGGVPFQIPINRTLAISLPRACNSPGVPFQCKAAGAPIPAPGPIPFGPSLSPEASPSGSPNVPEPITPGLAPEADFTPPSTVGSEAPTATVGSRPALTPSSAMLSNGLPPSELLLLGLAFLVFKFY